MRDLVFDETPAVVLVACRIGACPWVLLRDDRAAARRAALEHVRRTHPRDERPAKALELWLRRHAAFVE